MPLRDHFRPPLDNRHSWDELHGGWPMVIVQHLMRILPHHFIAAPGVHLANSAEIDVSSYEQDDPDASPFTSRSGNGGTATAVWAPPRPTLVVATDLPVQEEYEVRVYDAQRGRRLVAAVEIVSPANKDRPESRRSFVAKCVALLQKQVSVTIVDLVTVRGFNLYGELLAFAGQSDATLGADSPSIYTAALRTTKRGNDWSLEAWALPLTLGQPLPTLPLWLADNLALPLDLEASYEECCQTLRMA